MSKIPFKNFIITLLFCGKMAQEIIDRLKSFNYEVSEKEIVDIMNSIREILPPSILELFNNRILLDTNNETHVQWLKKFNIFELYHYITSADKNSDSAPEYFKWCEDCVWAHSYFDVMSVINIFMFNDEPLESISDIVMLKYRKKIGIGALELYRNIFWDTKDLNAKDAVTYCVPFRENTLIIRKFTDLDCAEVECPTGSLENIRQVLHNGSDVPVSFHDINYIKWKLGVVPKIPDTESFLQKAQTDCMYKFYEAMNMVQSVEIEEEDGTNSFGAFDNTKTIRRNVEEARAKLAKQWIDIYLKIKENTGQTDKDASAKFFDKMKQIEMKFDECEEHIVKISDVPDIFNDIKSDL